MCCSGGNWKREVVPDHKFDFVDTREFHSKEFGIRARYLWLYMLVVKSFLVYVSDIYTAVTMLTTSDWTNSIFHSCPKADCSIIPFKYGKWLFVGCIMISFLLLAYETRKTKKIIASRDISYAFSNVMANNYYSLRSYDHFCFFCHISNSTKKKDDFAFFVFFTFKSWKRLLFADAPRQTINAMTLYSFYLAHNTGANHDPRPFYDLSKYSPNFITTGLIISLIFTVLVCAGSLLMLLAAGVCYIPLLCYMQGNLKEYCCHKVDKRIAELMKKKHKQRTAMAMALARREAAGDFSHLKNKKGDFIANPLPQPTLPKVALDDFEGTDTSSLRTKVDTDYSQKWQMDAKSYQHAPEYPPASNGAPEYPPMPGYHSYDQYEHGHPDMYGPSAAYDHQGQHIYDDRYAASEVTLTQAAAPIAGHYEHAVPNYSYHTNPGAQPTPDRYVDYSEHVGYYNQDQYTHHAQQDQSNHRLSGLAYDQQYASGYGAPGDNRHGTRQYR